MIWIFFPNCASQPKNVRLICTQTFFSGRFVHQNDRSALSKLVKHRFNKRSVKMIYVGYIVKPDQNIAFIVLIRFLNQIPILIKKLLKAFSPSTVTTALIGSDCIP